MKPISLDRSVSFSAPAGIDLHAAVTVFHLVPWCCTIARLMAWPHDLRRAAFKAVVAIDSPDDDKAQDVCWWLEDNATLAVREKALRWLYKTLSEVYRLLVKAGGANASKDAIDWLNKILDRDLKSGSVKTTAALLTELVETDTPLDTYFQALRQAWEAASKIPSHVSLQTHVLMHAYAKDVFEAYYRDGRRRMLTVKHLELEVSERARQDGLWEILGTTEERRIIIANLLKQMKPNFLGCIDLFPEDVGDWPVVDLNVPCEAVLQEA